jgi:hypothetical protein
MEDLFDLNDPVWAALLPVGGQPWRLLLDVPALVAALTRRPGRASDGRRPSVHPTAQVTGSYLGENVQIHEGCSVRDSVVLAGTTIGHASEIARSIILPDCMIPRFNYVGSSLLGRGVDLGGATQLASTRYDRTDATSTPAR